MAKFPQLEMVVDQLKELIGQLIVLHQYLLVLTSEQSLDKAEQFLQNVSAECEDEE